MLNVPEERKKKLPDMARSTDEGSEKDRTSYQKTRKKEIYESFPALPAAPWVKLS